MLCEELLLRVSTLLMSLIRRHTRKKILYSIQQKLTLSSSLKWTLRLHSSVKVRAAQSKIAYCRRLKSLNIHKKKALH